MSALNVKTHSGEETSLPKEKVDSLHGILSDRMLVAASTDYDTARTVWNGMIDRRPALIIRCTSNADVIEAVNLARENNLLLAVRGGGHNIAGNAVCDGGVMIDLSPMRAVTVDSEARTALVQGGALLADFDEEAQKHGLATPLGINSTTGVAGLTLGGGFGWLSRKYGLSIDNLVSAEIVTADGQLLRASEQENADLFWGIRGGGGNFGVVTSFEFRLHPVGPEVFAGLVAYPAEKAPELLRYYRDVMPGAPEELAVWFVLRKAPPAPFIPEAWHGKDMVALAVCWFGDPERAEEATRPFRSFGEPIADIIGPMPFAAWQKALDATQAAGARNYWKSHNFLELSDGLIEVLLEFARRMPDMQSDISFAQLGGAIGRVAPDATAYIARDAEFAINVHGRWGDPAKDAECIAWARDLFSAAAPFASGGAYVNFMTQEEQNRVRQAYGANYDRLVEVKNKYDPTNLFRLNQNIRPTV